MAMLLSSCNVRDLIKRLQFSEFLARRSERGEVSMNQVYIIRCLLFCGGIQIHRLLTI